MDIKAYRKEFSRLGFKMLVCAIIITGSQLAGQYALLYLKPEWTSDINKVLASAMIPQYVIAFPAAFLIMSFGGDKRAIEKHKMKPLHFWAAFPMGYALLMAGNIIGLLVTFAIGILKGAPVRNTIPEIVGDSNIWITCIYTVLLAPIFEELLFRKMLCDRVVKYGQGAAIILSGLMFGLFHGNFNQFFYAAFLGGFFAFIYVKTGNIKYTIGLHMLVNSMGSVISGLFVQNVDPENMSVYSLLIMAFFALLIYGLVITGIVLLLVNRSKLKADEGEIILEKKLRNNIMLVNIGMILYYAFSLLNMILQALIG